MCASAMLSNPQDEFIIYYYRDCLHVWYWERIQGSLLALSPEICIISSPVLLKLRNLIVHICYIYAADFSGRQSLAFVKPGIECFAVLGILYLKPCNLEKKKELRCDLILTEVNTP